MRDVSPTPVGPWMQPTAIYQPNFALLGASGPSFMPVVDPSLPCPFPSQGAASSAASAMPAKPASGLDSLLFISGIERQALLEAGPSALNVTIDRVTADPIGDPNRVTPPSKRLDDVRQDLDFATRLVKAETQQALSTRDLAEQLAAQLFGHEGSSPRPKARQRPQGVAKRRQQQQQGYKRVAAVRAR